MGGRKFYEDETIRRVDPEAKTVSGSDRPEILPMKWLYNETTPAQTENKNLLEARLHDAQTISDQSGDETIDEACPEENLYDAKTIFSNPEDESLLEARLHDAQTISDQSGDETIDEADPEANTISCQQDVVFDNHNLPTECNDVEHPKITDFHESDTMDDEDNKKLGKYKILKKIGQGGMGAVYLAHDENGHKRAIKTILPEKASDSLLKRFKKEADVMQLLDSRNICRIHEVGKEGNLNYIVMEHVDGISLEGLLNNMDHSSRSRGSTRTDITKIVNQISSEENKAGYSLPLQQTLGLAKTICETMQIVHEKGIIHRDLKPANIMIRQDGTPVIMDFGLAKETDTDSLEGLTLSGQVMGTLAYMSPEQADSSKHADERADIYSLGAIFYEMLTGKRYFEPTGEIFPDILRLQDYIGKKASEMNPQIDLELENILQKSLMPEKDKRYTSALQLSSDIERYQKGDIVLANPLTVRYRIKKWAKRNRKPVVTGAFLGLLALSGGIGTMFYQQLEAERNSPQNLAFKAYRLELDEFKREKEFQNYEEKKRNHQQLLENIVENSRKFPDDDRFKELLVNQRETYRQFLRNTDLKEELDSLREEIIELGKQEEHSDLLFRQKLSKFGRLLSYQKLARFLPVYTSKDKLEDSPIPKGKTFMPEKARGGIEFGEIKDLSTLYSHAKDLVWAYQLTEDEDFLRYAEEVTSIYTPELIRSLDEESINHCLAASETISELYKITGKEKYLEFIVASADALLERKTDSGILHTFDFPALDTSDEESLEKSRKKRQEKLKGEREKTAMGYSRFAGVSLLANRAFLEAYELTGDKKYLDASDNLTRLFIQDPKSRQKPFLDPITGMVPYQIFLDKKGKVFVMDDVFCNSIYSSLKRLFDLEPQAALLDSFVSLYEHDNDKLIEKSAKDLAQIIMNSTPDDNVNHVMTYPVINSPFEPFNDRDFKAPGIQLEIIETLLRLSDISVSRYKRESNVTDNIEEYAHRSLLEVFEHYVRTDTSPFTLTPNCSITTDRFHMSGKGGDDYDKDKRVVDFQNSENIFEIIHRLTENKVVSSYTVSPEKADIIELDGSKDSSYGDYGITDFFSSRRYPDPSKTVMYTAADDSFFYFYLESSMTQEIIDDIKKAEKVFKSEGRDSKLKFAGHNIVLARQDNPDKFYVFGSNIHHLYDAERFDTGFDSDFEAKTILEDDVLRTEFKIPKSNYDAMSAFTVLPMDGAYYHSMQGSPDNCYIQTIREEEQTEFNLPLLRINNGTD